MDKNIFIKKRTEEENSGFEYNDLRKKSLNPKKNTRRKSKEKMNSTCLIEKTNQES